jgi:glycogen synthase
VTASPTRHVLLTSDLVGGVWDFAWVLARELVRSGSHRVTLLAFGEPSPEQRRQAEQAGATLVSAPLRLEWMQDSQVDVRAALRLVEDLAAELRPSVVHANQFIAACAAVAAPVVLTAHSDVLSWGKWTLGVGGAVPDDWLDYAALVRRALETACAVVAVSGFLADELAALYRVPRARLRVIHDGWPLPSAAPAPLGARPRLTLVAGRAWDAAKNVRLVAAALDDWPERARVGRVLLAGSLVDPDSGALAEPPPGLEPAGYLARDELDGVLARARLYLSPARYDPFGLLPLQAALSGCPLLLSDIPPYRELWDGAAAFFRADDVPDLRRRWLELLEDEQLAGRLARRAWERARLRYDAAAMAGRYVALFDELAGAGQALGHRLGSPWRTRA